MSNLATAVAPMPGAPLGSLVMNLAPPSLPSGWHSSSSPFWERSSCWWAGMRATSTRMSLRSAQFRKASL
jgi:hypothetical protein